MAGNRKRLLDEENDSFVQLQAKLFKKADKSIKIGLQPPKILNYQQQKIFDHITSVDSFPPIFVSGSAGTGKSALLVALRDFWKDKNKIVWIVSYTNLAARNVNGKTCHFTFRLDFNLEFARGWNGVFPDYLIIDEISMIPQKMLDAIHKRLVSSTKVETPFGGVKTIVFGDLYQLPPVDDRERSVIILPPYASKLWQHFHLYELTVNMRQSENDFIEALNKLRLGDKKCQPFFNKKVTKNPPVLKEKIKYTSLVSTHREADQINSECYEYTKKINNIKEETLIELSKTKENRKALFNRMMIFTANQEQLIFREGMKYCVGTRVMVTHNEEPFCNGDVGIVTQIFDSFLQIRREYDNNEFLLHKSSLAFEIKNDYKTVTVVNGFALCYGWALTIHKAQGMTVKKLIVHPEKTFVEGQAYVALSRVTHCDGLILINPIPDKSIVPMDEVTNVYENMNKLVI